MALILLPFFMPLMLLGWIFPPEHERELEEEQAEKERQFGQTWALVFGWADEPAEHASK
jgi:hypothetical protein